MMSRKKSLIQDERGTTAVEYGLIAALIVLAMVSALTQLAGTTTNMWNDVTGKIDNAS